MITVPFTDGSQIIWSVSLMQRSVHSPLSRIVDLGTKLISDNSTFRTFSVTEYIRATIPLLERIFVASQSIPFDLELRNRKANSCHSEWQHIHYIGLPISDSDGHVVGACVCRVRQTYKRLTHGHIVEHEAPPSPSPRRELDFGSSIVLTNSSDKSECQYLLARL